MLSGIAKTGSGKTLAFLLPMFRHVLDQPPLESGDGPIALLMAPTRELALQTYNEARKFAKVLDLRVACIYGGSNISDQVNKGVHPGKETHAMRIDCRSEARCGDYRVHARPHDRHAYREQR